MYPFNLLIDHNIKQLNKSRLHKVNKEIIRKTKRIFRNFVKYTEIPSINSINSIYIYMITIYMVVVMR